MIDEHDEYLWDRSGRPDPTIEWLEQTLGRLRHEPDEIEVAPELDQVPARSRWKVMVLAACVAAAAVVIALSTGRRPPIEPLSKFSISADPALSRPSPFEITAPSFDSPPPAVVSPPRKRPAAPEVAPQPKPVPEPPPSAATEPGSRAVELDCLLDDPRCRRQVPSRPPTLDATAIKSAMAPARPRLQACLRGHAPKLEKIRIRFVVEGSTGRILQPTIDEPHLLDHHPLAKCVAEVLSTVSFPPVEKPTTGIMFTIRR